jgi:hypothetical protein
MSSSAFGLLDALRRLDVKISVEGDDLGIDAPVGVMTPGLIELVRDAKPELLAILDLSDTNPEIFGGASGW